MWITEVLGRNTGMCEFYIRIIENIKIIYKWNTTCMEFIFHDIGECNTFFFLGGGGIIICLFLNIWRNSFLYNMFAYSWGCLISVYMLEQKIQSVAALLLCATSSILVFFQLISTSTKPLFFVIIILPVSGNYFYFLLKKELSVKLFEPTSLKCEHFKKI